MKGGETRNDKAVKNACTLVATQNECSSGVRIVQNANGCVRVKDEAGRAPFVGNRHFHHVPVREYKLFREVHEEVKVNDFIRGIHFHSQFSVHNFDQA